MAKDATRAFCTGCLEPACLIASTRGLSPSQIKEADRWIELYEHHDKYKLVGQIRKPQPAQAPGETAEGEEERSAAAAAAAAADEAWEVEQVERAQAAEGSRKWRPFRLR